MSADDDDLPLFSGPHIPMVRFRNALERLDMRAACADAPAQWQEHIARMADVLEVRGGIARAPLEGLLACRCAGWPPELDRAWQRLVGRRLNAGPVPGTVNGELAAAFLLRGGERDRARASLERHLSHKPRDWHGWQLLAHFEPVRAAARCAFHGGPVLESLVGDLLDRMSDDEVEPPASWLLSYAWFADAVTLAEIESALAAEHMLADLPLPVGGDGRAFAWYLLDAGGRPFSPASVGVIEARQRLSAISRSAFRRYLARVSRRRL